MSPPNNEMLADMVRGLEASVNHLRNEVGAVQKLGEEVRKDASALRTARAVDPSEKLARLEREFERSRTNLENLYTALSQQLQQSKPAQLERDIRELRSAIVRDLKGYATKTELNAVITRVEALESAAPAPAEDASYAEHIADMSDHELTEEVADQLAKVLDAFEGGDDPSEHQIKDLYLELRSRV